jgi:hypothetical protein
MKRCPRCEQELPETAFTARGYRFGKRILVPYCRECYRKQAKPVERGKRGAVTRRLNALSYLDRPRCTRCERTPAAEGLRTCAKCARVARTRCQVGDCTLRVAHAGARWCKGHEPGLTPSDCCVVTRV